MSAKLRMVASETPVVSELRLARLVERFWRRSMYDFFMNSMSAGTATALTAVAKAAAATSGSWTSMANDLRRSARRWGRGRGRVRSKRERSERERRLLGSEAGSKAARDR